MPISKEKERISVRVPKRAYQALTHAAEISGATLNQFLVQAALEKAQIIIEKNRTIMLSMRSAKVFFDAIENPPQPKGKLKRAMKLDNPDLNFTKTIIPCKRYLSAMCRLGI